MKFREGFISNSSSTSFVVVGSDGDYVLKEDFVREFVKDGILVVDSTTGETGFGWGPDEIYNIGSRIIFAFIQTDYGRNSERIQLLEKVIKEYAGISEIIWNIGDYNNDEQKDYAYIDHQSSYSEGQNLEIFESEDILKNFIFSRKSYIVLDNDNY